jgi:hypothetical protein
LLAIEHAQQVEKYLATQSKQELAKEVNRLKQKWRDNQSLMST